MSYKIMQMVWEDESLHPTHRLVLLSLVDHADKDGKCFPSVSRLRKRTGLSERAIQGAIAKLEAAGWVTVKRNAGMRGSNLFSLNTPAANAPPQDMHPRSKCTLPPQDMHPHPRSKCTQTFNITPNEPIPPKPPKGHEDDFALFWSAYPKRQGGNPRKPALKAYASKRKAGAKHDEIMAALRAYVAEQKALGKIGSPYIPMAATWLNREEWAQPAEPSPAPATAADTRVEVWRGATRSFVNAGRWPLADRSPPPDHPDTLVPPDVLREFNITQAA